MGLYPPIVASSMPAFNIAEGKVRIYFTLSNYNSIRTDDIQAVHVTCRRQSSNVNVLNQDTEIAQKIPQQGNTDKAFHRYYVELTNDEIKGGFETDVLYKVQLRLSSIPYTESATIPFYTNNIENFSQWSTVCIIKAITAPQFYIDDFYTGQAPQQTDVNNYYYTLADFVGIYKQNESSEVLKKWRLRLLTQGYSSDSIDLIDEYTLVDSDWVLNSANNYNVDDSTVIACSLPYELQDGVNYKLLFQIQTKNDYYNSLLYNFTCVSQLINKLSGDLNTYINEEQGYIKLNFTSTQSYMGNLVIRRADSKNNFLKWEDIKFFESYDSPNFVYYDFTAQSGMLYRYLVQKIDSRGRRGNPVYDQTYQQKTGTIAEWENAFLLESTGNGDLKGTKQLKLKYDFQISSYKTNISESRTDTIGSKYPFIRRNGNMYYRSFPISGTITGYMDSVDLFTSEDQLYGDYVSYYKQFRGQKDQWQTYVNQYDYTYERKFREKVEQFLYNSKPKLYKSMQEGNIFIKLMEVSLTPKQQLGRLIYTFSATAYEIDEAEINTYNNYGLITIGNYNPNIFTTSVILGQISSFDFNDNIEGNLFKAGQDIIGAGAAAAANSIAKDIKYNESFNNKIVTDFNINWLRLTIESDPYLIIQDNGIYRPFDDVIPDYITNNSSYIDKSYITSSNSIDYMSNNYQDNINPPINYKLYQMQSTYNDINVYLGWLFTINGQQIIVAPPNNIYEIKEDNFLLHKQATIIPAKDTAMLIDYRLINVIEEDLTLSPKNIRIDRINGQLVGTYSKQNQIIASIRYKYKFTYQQGKERIKRFVDQGLSTVLVDTQPGAVIKLKTTAMDSEQRFVVNETGELNFDPNETTVYINKLIIEGINIPLELINNRGSYNSLSEVSSPVEKDLVEVNNKKYCYYRSKWCQSEQIQGNTIDVYCSVDALIFYFVSVEEDIY